MRTLTLVLGFTAAVFAGSTVYLAHQLSVERARNAELVRLPAHRPVAHPDPVTVVQPSLGAASRQAAPSESPSHMEAVSAGNGEMSDIDLRRIQAEYARQFLAELSDPVRRQETIAERKMMFRRAYPRVDRVLGLTPGEYSRFTEQLAKQQLAGQEADARCMLNPDCRTSALNEMQMVPEETSREIRELLGPARLRQFEQYKTSMGERESVSQFRNRLPDDLRFSEDVTENLVSALADERQQIYQEARQQGRDVTGFASGAGMVFVGAESGDADERYRTARQNNQRFHDRAAQILNPEQLRAFDEMQEENLIALRSLLRSKDVLTTAEEVNQAE